MLAVVLLCGAALADMPGGMPVMDEAAFDARAGEQPTGPSDGSAPVMPAPDAADAAMQGGSASAPSVGSTSSGGQYVPPSVAFAHHNAKPTPKPSPSVAYFGFPTGGFSQNNIFKSPTEKLDWEKSVLLSRRRRVVVPTTVAPTPAPTPKKGPTWPSYFKRITKAPSGAHVVAKRPPAQPSQMCGATTSQRTTYWKLHGTGGLYFDVTTTHCKFKSRPVYISSVVGDQAHWTLQGTHSISKATKTGFRVVVLHPSMRGDTLLRAANDYHWVVSWIGNVGGNCGMTKELGGDWKETKKGALYMDVDTSNSAFHDTPRYFTTLHGHEKHWRTEGAHTVYYSKASGFRVYIIFDECFGGTCVDKKVTAAMADKYKWTIHWVGTVGEKAPDASVYCVKDTNGHDASGQSGLDWKKASGSAGLFIDVDTSASHFQQRPTYVTSVTTQFIHWRVTGAGSVFRPAKDSFRLYLAKAVYAKFAKLYKWRVNYLGYDGPVDCQVSPVWTKWSECSKSCDTGAQVRTRTVFQESFNGGIPCPLTKQSRPCNPHKCPPVDCIVSNWTKWVPCSLTCGNGTTHHVRSVLDLPKSGPQYARAGRACPVLRQAQECNIDPCPVDCKVSGWSSWTPCYSPPSVHCGVGYRHRKKTVVIFPKYGGQACPPQLAQSKTCYHKGNCIGSGPSSMCGGATPRGSLPHNGLSAIGETEWKLAGAHGISVDVDTSSCAFKITPQYVVQVMGIEENAFFGFLSGLSSVTHPTKRGFRVTIWYDNLSAQDLLGAARDYRWYISWVGETGRNAGITVSGHTGWKQDANTESANTVYADVDATLCSFEDTPRYFTALHGDKLTERAQGALVVYRPSARGFRLYATLSTPMSPALAEASNWTVSWVGISASVAATKESLTSTGSGPWQKKGTMLGSVLYKKVAFPPSRNMYVAPLVIPSVELAEPHWEMIGAGSVSQPGKHGFKFLLGKVNLEISLAKQRTWRVNYLSYEVLNCKLSGWTPWSACSRTCAGGQQIRVRKVLVPHGRGGRKCPSVPLRQSRYCNWEQCIGVGPSNPCGGISSSTTGWMLNMTAWKAHGIGSIYTTVDTSACKFTHTPYYIADMVGERFHWQLTGSISLSRWSSTSFRVTVHHPRMRGLTLLRSAKMYNWRTSWIGEAGRNAGITRQGKSGWRQASSPDISDWTLQLDVDTSHCQYTGVPRYFTALVGDSGVYRLHGEHVVYRSTARGFRVYVVADRFVTTTIAERKRWAVAWMGTTDSRSGTSSMDWHIVRDASNNVQQMHGASGGSGVGVYIDVSTKVSLTALLTSPRKSPHLASSLTPRPAPLTLLRPPNTPAKFVQHATSLRHVRHCSGGRG